MPTPAPSDPLPRPAVVSAPRRWPGWLVLPALLALGAGAWLLVDRLLVDRRPIVVGILHSRTGPMAPSEQAMIDAELSVPCGDILDRLKVTADCCRKTLMTSMVFADYY